MMYLITHKEVKALVDLLDNMEEGTLTRQQMVRALKYAIEDIEAKVFEEE